MINRSNVRVLNVEGRLNHSRSSLFATANDLSVATLLRVIAVAGSSLTSCRFRPGPRQPFVFKRPTPNEFNKSNLEAERKDNFPTGNNERNEWLIKNPASVVIDNFRQEIKSAGLGSKSKIFVLATLLAVSAHAQYKARVTVENGNSFTVNQLKIDNNRLYSANGQASSAVSMIKDVEFGFDEITLRICQSKFESGDYKTLESLLSRYVNPVKQYSYLPGNLSDYLVWMLRVQYWNKNYAGATETIQLLSKSKNPVHVNAGSLYKILILLDEGKTSVAEKHYLSIVSAVEVSSPIALYIRSRLALERGDYRAAMKHTAIIIAFHSRDVEWIAPATALEALIYQRSGRFEQAAIVANELMMAYPGTQWSKLGETIKKESTGNAGG